MYALWCRFDEKVLAEAMNTTCYLINRVIDSNMDLTLVLIPKHLTRCDW